MKDKRDTDTEGRSLIKYQIFLSLACRVKF